jgi:hypothetical protein
MLNRPMQTTLKTKSTLIVSILLYPFNEKTNQIFPTACVEIKREAKEMEMLIFVWLAQKRWRYGLCRRDGDDA